MQATGPHPTRTPDALVLGDAKRKPLLSITIHRPRRPTADERAARRRARRARRRDTAQISAFVRGLSGPLGGAA